jgi:hypothetical protein
MGLFSRFRRRRRTEEYVGRHRPGSWSELGLPPAAESDAGAAATEPPPTPPPAALVPTMLPAPQVVSPRLRVSPVVVRRVEISARPRVRLAFADGSVVGIEDASATSHALQDLAARLLDEPR